MSCLVSPNVPGAAVLARAMLLGVCEDERVRVPGASVVVRRECNQVAEGGRGRRICGGGGWS